MIIRGKEKCLNYCIDCGAILSSKKAIRCNKCNSLLRAKTSPSVKRIKNKEQCIMKDIDQ